MVLYHLNLINSSCEIRREGPGMSAFVNETYPRVVLPGPSRGGVDPGWGGVLPRSKQKQDPAARGMAAFPLSF